MFAFTKLIRIIFQSCFQGKTPFQGIIIFKTNRKVSIKDSNAKLSITVLDAEINMLSGVYAEKLPLNCYAESVLATDK